MHLKVILLIFGLVAGTLNFVSMTAKAQDEFASDSAKPLESLGKIEEAAISESSGLARSRKTKNAVWTHNDSGHPPELFLNDLDGSLLAKVTLANATSIDWEAMTSFSMNDQPYLLVGDVGDNARKRKSYQLYLIKEPNFSHEDVRQGKGQPPSRRLNAKRLEFSYPDGPKNCEAISYDPVSQRLWLVEKVYFDAKQKTPPGVYTLPVDLDASAPLVAKRVGDFPIRNVTGMAFSPDTKRLLIRNYLTAHLYRRQKDESWIDVLSKFKPETVILPLQRQGEAVCFESDSRSAIVSSEKKYQSLWRVNLNNYLQRPRRLKTENPLDEASEKK